MTLLSAPAPAPPAPSDGPVRVVLDTDTYNEVDDQFALVHALLSPERIRLEAVYAAPFVNARAADPAEGMERSLEEIGRILTLVGHGPKDGVFAGSRRFLPGPGRPVDSAAARDLVERAHRGPGTLVVVSIGAPTNIASALLLDPRIAERIQVVWLGGHALHWPHTREFNLEQDVHASRRILEGHAPLVLLPCMGVVQMLATSVPELAHHLAGRGPLAEFLYRRVRDFPDRPAGGRCWHKVIWDLAATAWVVEPSWCPSEVVPARELTPDLRWSPRRPDPTREILWRVVREVRRDPILDDLFGKIGASARNPSPPCP